MRSLGTLTASITSFETLLLKYRPYLNANASQCFSKFHPRNHQSCRNPWILLHMILALSLCRMCGSLSHAWFLQEWYSLVRSLCCTFQIRKQTQSKYPPVLRLSRDHCCGRVQNPPGNLTSRQQSSWQIRVRWYFLASSAATSCRRSTVLPLALKLSSPPRCCTIVLSASVWISTSLALPKSAVYDSSSSTTWMFASELAVAESPRRLRRREVALAKYRLAVRLSCSVAEEVSWRRARRE